MRNLTCVLVEQKVLVNNDVYWVLQGYHGSERDIEYIGFSILFSQIFFYIIALFTSEQN